MNAIPKKTTNQKIHDKKKPIKFLWIQKVLRLAS